MMNPQGIPLHPSNVESTAASINPFFPQPRQQSSGRLDQDVIMNADQMW